MGGAGEVITAARSLYRGESSDNVLGVMGADFPLRHFYRYKFGILCFKTLICIAICLRQ